MKDILKSFTSQVRKFKANGLALKLICFNLCDTWATSQGSNKRSVHYVVLNYFGPINLFQGLKNNNTVWSWKMKASAINPFFLDFYLPLPSPVKGWAWDMGILISCIFPPTPISSSTHVHFPCAVNNWPNWARKIRLEAWKWLCNKMAVCFCTCYYKSKIQVES